MTLHKTKEWADAITNLVVEQKDPLEQYRLEALLITKSYRVSNDLKQLLRSPGITQQEKEQIIDKVFASINKTFRNAIKLMTRKYLTKNIDDAFYKVYEQLSHNLNILTGTIESSKILTEEQIKELEKHYTKKMNKKVELYFYHAPYLVHGIKVAIEGEVHDGSIHGHLKHLKHSLLK